MHPVLQAEDLTVEYGSLRVLNGVNLRVEAGQFVAIIGPNAAGKSTLLKALARLIPIQGGRVLLNGTAITDLSSLQVARQLAVLPQHQLVPPGVPVAEFITRGRYAHQGFLSRWSDEDEDATWRAIEMTGVGNLLHRSLDELSGGQRQRVWMAVVLAQDTPVLLLDEPTTFLDISHQLELLDLCAQLHKQGRTVVTVLHDLSHAAAYADRLVCVSQQRIVADGPPTQVLTEELLRQVFKIAATVTVDPVRGTAHVIAHHCLRQPC